MITTWLACALAAYFILNLAIFFRQVANRPDAPVQFIRYFFLGGYILVSPKLAYLVGEVKNWSGSSLKIQFEFLRDIVLGVTVLGAILAGLYLFGILIVWLIVLFLPFLIKLTIGYMTANVLGYYIYDLSDSKTDREKEPCFRNIALFGLCYIIESKMEDGEEDGPWELREEESIQTPVPAET